MSDPGRMGSLVLFFSLRGHRLKFLKVDIFLSLYCTVRSKQSSMREIHSILIRKC